MKKIVLDIETQNTFNEVGSRDPLALSISLLVVYDYSTDKYYSFLENELSQLWKLLENADMIIGYNSDYFDIPLLNKYYPGDLTKIKSLDILAEIRKAIDKRISLDSVAAGTLGTHKTAKGLEAVAWWQQGEIEKIRKYCQEDVKITKDIYDFAMANQYLRYRVMNDVQQFPINTSDWEKPNNHSINYTLPF
ncbi:MAG: ribonuclease H-like domain-containing protein [bacterium]